MNNKTKVVVAVVCLAVAGVVLAFQLGVFDSSAKGAKGSDVPEEFLDADEQGATDVTNPDGTQSRQFGFPQPVN